MIVKSILDFIVGTVDFSSFCLYVVLSPHSRSVPLIPGMDCRLQAALKARAPQITTHRRVLEMCSLCVCSALRRRMASLSFCSFPRGDGRPREGEGDAVNLSRSALSGEANFARWDCDFCFVLFMCWGGVFVVVLFFWKSFTFLSTLSSPSLPLFLFFLLGWGREMSVEFLNETKQTKQNLCILLWMRPHQTEGTCISEPK